ncbi:DNA-binding winged helix-turn-helix (wHTH) protein [Variovorax boronicumulans]|uniref:winged helix-turn-helix domain-containing protein n=1 Tax=Variovorax boronicumulans TaxID=436515 RepID=UPI00247606EA|nr:winged helix-turn-helix domain-containing protein [Variovorax boronicumulans]MDH6166487.1 DNA-binding winged helix-turn-helix (wHTH) protein [Variovorax boronicumulans]
MTEQKNLLIALYDADDLRSAALKSKLGSMGHQTIVFTRITNLPNILKRGRRRFDLLLAPLQEGLVERLLSLGQEASDMPTLLLVDPAQWGHPLFRGNDLVWCDVVDFDIARTQNEELAWRMRALLARRGKAALARAAQNANLAWGDYRFLERHRIVLHRDREIFLQPRQFDFALELFRNMGRVVTRDWLWSALWRATLLRGDSRVFDVCAANVRRKLELCAENGFVLKAVYGQGYLLSECVPLPGTIRRTVPAG